MPRICEQSGLLPVAPTPRDAGGTGSACVATRVRFLLVTAEAAALAVFGLTVCCEVALGAGEGVARGVGVAGGCDVVG
jgi:hypothetical protein